MTKAFVTIACLLSLCACSLPRIIVLNDPLDAREHNDLGVSYEARGEYDLARREYRAAAEGDKVWARPLINLGNVAAAQEEWATAARNYRAALRREPRNTEAMNNLAWVLLQFGASDAAIQWSRRVVAEAPEEPAYLDTLAEIQIDRGDEAAAAATLEQALSLELTPEERRRCEQKRALIGTPAR